MISSHWVVTPSGFGVAKGCARWDVEAGQLGCAAGCRIICFRMFAPFASSVNPDIRIVRWRTDVRDPLSASITTLIHANLAPK